MRVVRLRWRAAFGVAGVSLLALCFLSGCNRLFSSGASRDDLALVPADTAAVFVLNLKQARGSHLWQKFIEARDKDPMARREYQDFVQKCSLDPLADLDSIFLAVPPNAQQSRDYAMLLHGRYSPEAVVACAKKSAADRHETLTETDYNGTKLYALRSEGPFLAVLGKRAVAMASSSWIRHVVDLQSGKEAASASARASQPLRDMLSRTHTSDAFYWAGQVPANMAERLRSWPQLGSAGSLHSISGSLDIAKGLAIHADLDLGSDADATGLQTAANEQLTNLRQDTKLQIMGMASYLNTVQLSTHKSTFVFELRMTDQQVDDLVTRLSGLSRSLGSGF